MKKLPIAIAACIDKLNDVLDLKQIEEIKNCDKKELGQYHFTLGLYIRNNIVFAEKNENCINYFKQERISDPDQISSVIIRIYHRYLNNEDIKVHEIINENMDFMFEGMVEICYENNE